MPILYLGVSDVPNNEPPRFLDGRRPKKVASGTQTTCHGSLSSDAKCNAFALAYSIFLSPEPFASSKSQKIDDTFHKFLDSKEMETLGIPGVPTAAALKGVSHRLKLKKGAPRPSFIDTGMYQAHFKSWVE
jgi:hypothetical protein